MGEQEDVVGRGTGSGGQIGEFKKRVDVLLSVVIRSR
jgi:hypothetical protein